MDGIANLISNILELCFGAAFGIAEGAKISFTGTQEIYSSLWKTTTLICETVMEPIAICLVVLFFLIGIMDKLSSENFSLEHLIKSFITLFLGVYLVTNSLNLVIDLIELGNGLITKVANVVVEDIPTPEDISLMISSIMTGDDWQDAGNVILVVISAVPILIIALFEMILLLIMKGICLLRLIDITIRAAMSPIALSDCFSGQFSNSHAMNFIRSFGAVCLQGVFITIIANFVPISIAGILSAEMATSGGSILGALMKSFGVSLACLLVMFKTGSISKEILGAR